MGRVVTQEEIIKIVREGQKSGKTFAATNGCFDILHLGHAKYLQKTKDLADYSIVMLNSDSSVKILKGEGRPINNENDRAELLTFLSSVDYVVLFNEKSPAKLLENINHFLSPLHKMLKQSYNIICREFGFCLLKNADHSETKI